MLKSLDRVHRRTFSTESPQADFPTHSPGCCPGFQLSYGPDQIDQWRGAATYVDRILRGEKPGELPVQAPTKFELVINLKTAKALGLNIRPAFPLRADEVIE
jgi:ABC-type uncharacterized transport system substrate-binding protein